MAKTCTQCGAVLTGNCCSYCNAPVSLDAEKYAKGTMALSSHELNKPYIDTFGAASYALSVAAMLVIQFAVAIIAAIIMVMSGYFDLENAAFNISISLLFQISFTLIYFVHIKKVKARPQFNINFKMHPIWYVLSVVLGIICLICFIGITVMFVDFLEGIGLNFPRMQLIGVGIGTDILVVFTVVIAASIGEELIFRGSLLSGLIKRFSIPVAAFLSGILFSLMHMNPEQTVYQFFLGFAAAYLVIYSKSVVPGIIIHAVSNGLVILMNFWDGLHNIFNVWADISGGWLSPIFVIIGLAIIVGSCLLVNRFFNKEKVIDEIAIAHKKRQADGNGHHTMKLGGGSFWLWIIIPLIVCVIMWVIAFVTFMGG
ncbi:MAG: CPBP family intramembrane metalloprotease [Firmicutes bacterium]|nr:CPBP family intramembrane metalloprotease [Bacillota bacterium]